MWYISLYNTHTHTHTHTHTVAYFSGIKNEILPFARPWMDLGGIMLNEISHTDKDKYHMSSLTCGIRKTEQQNIQRYRKQIGIAREERERNRWSGLKIQISCSKTNKLQGCNIQDKE